MSGFSSFSFLPFGNGVSGSIASDIDSSLFSQGQSSNAVVISGSYDDDFPAPLNTIFDESFPDDETVKIEYDSERSSTVSGVDSPIATGNYLNSPSLVRDEDDDEDLYLPTEDDVPADFGVALKRPRTEAYYDNAARSTCIGCSTDVLSPESATVESSDVASPVCKSSSCESSVASPSSTTTATTASTTAEMSDAPVGCSPWSDRLASRVWPCGCARRIESLLEVNWIKSHPEFIQRLQQQLVECRKHCMGFCQTPYLCRIHAAPAIFNKANHPSRYQCMAGSHDGLAHKGRHHADYCYYCGDPNCCGGRWYSRDETHQRALKRAMQEEEGVKVCVEKRQRRERRVVNKKERASYHELPIVDNVSESDYCSESDCDEEKNKNVTASDVSDDEVTASAPMMKDAVIAISDIAIPPTQNVLPSAPSAWAVPRYQSIQSVGTPLLRRSGRGPHRLLVAALSVVSCVLLVATLILGSLLSQSQNGMHGGQAGKEMWQFCYSMQHKGDGDKSHSVSGCSICMEDQGMYGCNARSYFAELNITFTRPRGHRVDHIQLTSSDNKIILADNVIAPWSFDSNNALVKKVDPHRPPEDGGFGKKPKGHLAWSGFLVPPAIMIEPKDW